MLVLGRDAAPGVPIKAPRAVRYGGEFASGELRVVTGTAAGWRTCRDARDDTDVSLCPVLVAVAACIMAVAPIDDTAARGAVVEEAEIEDATNEADAEADAVLDADADVDTDADAVLDANVEADADAEAAAVADARRATSIAV